MCHERTIENRSSVERAPAASWDVAVVDAFDARRTAQELLEPSFFLALARVLRPGGALAFNVIGSLGGDGPVARAVRGARAAFEDVRVVPVLSLDETYAPDTLRNVVVVAVRRE